LEILLGHAIAPATTVRDFLSDFTQRPAAVARRSRGPRVGAERRAAGLAASNRQLLLWSQQRTPVQSATLDVDGSIYETTSAVR